MEYDHSIADYYQAIRLKPDYADAYYRRGLVYFVRKGVYDQPDIDQAIADYAQAVQLNPDLAGAQSALQTICSLNQAPNATCKSATPATVQPASN